MALHDESSAQSWSQLHTYKSVNAQIPVCHQRQNHNDLKQYYEWHIPEQPRSSKSSCRYLTMNKANQNSANLSLTLKRDAISLWRDMASIDCFWRTNLGLRYIRLASSLATKTDQMGSRKYRDHFIRLSCESACIVTLVAICGCAVSITHASANRCLKQEIQK
jgi:hypothetical protein